MGNLVGIDLGTTNSVAAFKFEQVEVVDNYDNPGYDSRLVRSVVTQTPNGFEVGSKALLGNSSPKDVITSIKRLMGRGFADTVVQDYLASLPYKVTQSTKGTDNSLSVWIGNIEYQPEDISAEILKHVAVNAQRFQEVTLGQKGKITHAVVTIPAYFNDKQRHATQTAVIRAGLGLLELLPEPTAAAISYGFNPNSEDGKSILVYDFGGGTFDSSLITVLGNQFIESGKAGDLWLGGNDIDNKLIDLVKSEVAKQEDLDDIDGLIDAMPGYQRSRFLSDLKLAVELAKIDLGRCEKTQIMPSTPLLDDLGMAIPISVEISRDKFEKIITPLIERTIAICRDTLKYSDYPEDAVDVVLLVGGSSQIPLVQRKVSEAFGFEKVVVHPEPMYAVAQGAAIVAAGLTSKVSTVSRDYFIQLVDEPRYTLIERGDILPVTTSHTFKTEADGQRLIHFKFFSPDLVSSDLDGVLRDERIGDMWLALDQAYPKGTEVAVTVELDEKNNSLQITAALKNNPTVRANSSFSRGGIDEEISKEVESILEDLKQANNLTDKGVQEAYEIAGRAIQAANQIQGEEDKPRQDRIAAAQQEVKELSAFSSEERDTIEFFIVEFEFVIEHCQSLIPDSQVEILKQLVTQLNQALTDNDMSRMQKLEEDCMQELTNLPVQVQMILAARNTISRVRSVDPTLANSMADKFARMLMAMENEDSSQTNQLWQELVPDLVKYGDQEIETGNLATGITR